LKALIFDTETTDLIKNRHAPLPNQPHITELFGLVLRLRVRKGMGDRWLEDSSWWSLFNPGIPLNKEVQRITGLDDEALKTEPSFRSKASEVKALIESCDIVVAHNLSFDLAMVTIEMDRINVKVNWPDKRICTVEATEHFKGRRLKLIELHEHLFGEGFENAHRAENDVRPLTRCFIKLWDDGVI
jgi:DNA polymerase-3 subunit alpha